jgi:hypothetical protein
VSYIDKINDHFIPSISYDYYFFKPERSFYSKKNQPTLRFMIFSFFFRLVFPWMVQYSIGGKLNLQKSLSFKVSKSIKIKVDLYRLL